MVTQIKRKNTISCKLMVDLHALGLRPRVFPRVSRSDNWKWCRGEVLGKLGGEGALVIDGDDATGGVGDSAGPGDKTHYRFVVDLGRASVFGMRRRRTRTQLDS